MDPPEFHGAEFIRVGPPVYRNPIQLGPIRPTIKQRLGPRNHHSLLRIGPRTRGYHPYNYQSNQAFNNGNAHSPHSSGYARHSRNNQYESRYEGPPRVSRSARGHSNRATNQQRWIPHRSNSPDHNDSHNSRPESHSRRRRRSASLQRVRSPTPSDNQELHWEHRKSKDKSSIVIKRDLRKGKRTVQYDSADSKKSRKPSQRKEKSDLKKTPSTSAACVDDKVNNENETSEVKANDSPKSSKNEPVAACDDEKVENNNMIQPASNEAGITPGLIVIESISGCSSPGDENEIDEEDVEVLQLRRAALEAMVKKLDESPPKTGDTESGKSIRTNTSPSTANQDEQEVIVIDDSDCPSVPSPPLNNEPNMDTDEKSLREKLLVDISKKRKLNVTDQTKPEQTPPPDKPVKAPLLDSTSIAAAKHSPIKFPSASPKTPNLISSSKVGHVPVPLKPGDLRHTLLSKAYSVAQSLPTAMPFASLSNNHPMRVMKSRTKLVNFHKHRPGPSNSNRVFNTKLRHGEEMGNITITIPNTAKKVIIPLDVPSTDEEREFDDASSEPESVNTDDKRKSRKPLNVDESGSESRSGKNQAGSSHRSQVSYTKHVQLETPDITLDHLPETFQLRLAKLLKEAREDSQRSIDAEKESERRKKEKLLRDLQRRVKRIEEEEENIRKEKAELALLKAQRRKKVSSQAQASSTSSNSTPSVSPSKKFQPVIRATPSPNKISSGPNNTNTAFTVTRGTPPPFDVKSSFQVLKHLPIHKQVEYIKLQSQILEHEHKVSEARFTLEMTEAQDLSIEDTEVLNTKSNMFENSIVDIHIENQLQGAGDHANTGSIEGSESMESQIQALFQREKVLKAKLMENMEISQNHLALKGKENELVNSRKSACEAMSSLISNILRQSQNKMSCRQLEEKITLLQYQLKVITDSLREEQCKLDAAIQGVEAGTRQIKDMKQRCQDLEKMCLELGRKAKGPTYKVPSTGAEEVEKRTAEVQRMFKAGVPTLKKTKNTMLPVQLPHHKTDKTPAQMLRLKVLARCLKRKPKCKYNWRKSSASSIVPLKKRRDSRSHEDPHSSNTALTQYFDKNEGAETDDEEDVLLLPRRTFADPLMGELPKIERVGMPKYEEYVSPLRLVKGEDNGFLQEQMRGMAVRKIHPAITLCSFELRAFCNSEACSLQHLYRPKNFS